MRQKDEGGRKEPEKRTGKLSKSSSGGQQTLEMATGLMTGTELLLLFYCAIEKGRLWLTTFTLGGGWADDDGQTPAHNTRKNRLWLVASFAD